MSEEILRRFAPLDDRHRFAPPKTETGKTMFNVDKIRKDFPILHQTVRENPLIYLDSAATTQKPTAVIESLTQFYKHNNANVHRGIHTLSDRATRAYEAARTAVANFIGAAHRHEVIFLRGTTEAINLVAQSYGRGQLKAGDEIILSQMEHHSNIVPWQILRDQIGVVLRIIPIDAQGDLVLPTFEALLNAKTRLVAITHVSNALGTVNPVEAIIEKAHQHDIPVLLDGAQAAAHIPINVQALNCDFYTFSSHKMYGPSGIGVLYGKEKWLENMAPYQGGGEMIREVQFEKTTYNVLPHKFEAGTPAIEGAIGLKAAIDYLTSIDSASLQAYEQHVLNYATQQLSDIPGLQVIGQAKNKVAIVSFILEGIHPHDIGTILDHEGIAIRSGHHCAMPLMTHLGLPATARASFGMYNTVEEVDALVRGIYAVKKVLERC
jgi:cysteine desulfurase/selenocysteine lyase